MLNDNKKQKGTLLKIIFKDEKNKPNIQIKKHSKENKNVGEKSKKIVTDKVTPKKENGSRLSETKKRWKNILNFLKSNFETIIIYIFSVFISLE